MHLFTRISLVLLYVTATSLHGEAVLAEESPSAAAQTPPVSTTLPEVSVKANREKETGINPTQSITTISSQELQRLQPSNIFDAVRSVPGVSISGGPRPSGMTFSIRGYSDSEDVMVKVDGVPKGFEKYRMGGTFIEPELLKSIEVQRGPQISSGSGSLGGTIIATTKNAADLLQPGQRYGAKVKFGYGNNNDEYSRSYMVYGRPDDRLDILYNYSNRQSKDMELGNGTILESSAVASVSKLLKFSVFPTDSLEFVTSLVSFDDKGLQPYDATGGQPGTFGNVVRAIDDQTWSETIYFRPDTRFIDLKVAFGGGHTKLQDTMAPGMSSLNGPERNCDGLIWRPNPSLTRNCHGNLNDYYTYKTRSMDITNTSHFVNGPWFKFSTLFGYQYNENKRDIERFYDNQTYVMQTALYPNGFNASAPPGSKSFHAFYVQPRFEFGQFSMMPGYRVDEYLVEADGGTLGLLAPYKQANKILFTRDSLSLGLAYEVLPRNNPEKLTLYSNYGQGFRPPLIDEYFTQGPFSRCLRTSVNIPGITMVNGQASGICGDLYKPQTSASAEIGVSYLNPNLWNTGTFLSGKLNLFHIDTENLLLSLRENADGSITQDGYEKRNGVEFETFLQYKAFYLRSAYSRTSGKLFDGSSFVPLYTVPGNALNLNFGTQLSEQVEVNLTYRKVWDRNVIIGGGGISSPLVFGTQDGYQIWNANLRWQPSKHLAFRVVGENLRNEEYRLDSAMGGLGIFAQGRNIKFFVELTY